MSERQCQVYIFDFGDIINRGVYMAYDEKSKERTIRYMKEKRDKLTLNLPAGDKERYRTHAEQIRKKSLTSLIVDLIEEDIKSAKENGEK